MLVRAQASSCETSTYVTVPVCAFWRALPDEKLILRWQEKIAPSTILVSCLVHVLWWRMPGPFCFNYPRETDQAECVCSCVQKCKDTGPCSGIGGKMERRWIFWNGEWGSWVIAVVLRIRFSNLSNLLKVISQSKIWIPSLCDKRFFQEIIRCKFMQQYISIISIETAISTPRI
jgi:hypothetical protein